MSTLPTIERPKVQFMIDEITAEGFLVPDPATQQQMEELYWLTMVCKDAMGDREPEMKCFGDYVEKNEFCDGKNGGRPCSLRKQCERMKVIQNEIKGGKSAPTKENTMTNDPNVTEPSTTEEPKTVETPKKTKKIDPSKMDMFGFRLGTKQSIIANAIYNNVKYSDVVDSVMTSTGLDKSKASTRISITKNALAKNGWKVTMDGKGKDKTIKLEKAS